MNGSDLANLVTSLRGFFGALGLPRRVRTAINERAAVSLVITQTVCAFGWEDCAVFGAKLLCKGTNRRKQGQNDEDNPQRYFLALEINSLIGFSWTAATAR